MLKTSNPKHPHNRGRSKQSKPSTPRPDSEAVSTRRRIETIQEQRKIENDFIL